MTKGAAEKVTGVMKDAAGMLTGDKELKGEGKLNKANDDVHNAVGNAKNAARNATVRRRRRTLRRARETLPTMIELCR